MKTPGIALLVAIFFFSFGPSASGSDSHDHAKDKHGHDEKEGKEGGHKHGENEKKGDHEEEGGGSFGPGKGVTEKSPLGIKFSNEALKTIDSVLINCSGPITSVPSTAIVMIKDSRSVFRVRDGWYKRVPVEILSKQPGAYSIRSADLKAGDKIVSTNVGFIRMAEVIAEEGASHSHSH